MFSRALLVIFFIAVLGYVAFCMYLFLYQRSLIYFPQPRMLASAPVMTLSRPDGDVMVTVLERDTPHALIYFGGNAEDVSINLPDFAQKFPDHAIYMLHYRQYGGSKGRISEAALRGDADALYELVRSRHEHVSVAGRSLGTTFAIQLAAEKPVSGLVLITPFDSLENVAKKLFPYAPVSLLLKDKYRSREYASLVTAPTLILVASGDEVIPAGSAENLKALFREGVAVMHVVSDTQHNTISQSPYYNQLFQDFMRVK